MHYDEAGAPSRFVGVTFDITERKQAEAQRHEWTQALERRVSERTKELVRTHDRLRGLAQELTLTEQRERQRLAGELHDYLAQMLVVTRLKVSQANQAASMDQVRDQLKKADDLIDQCLTYTRTLVAELMPPTLRQFGLAAGLQWLADTMVTQGLDVLVSVPAVTPPLSDDQTSLLYQSVRELLFNVLKHAGTKKARVILTTDAEDKLEIAVQDEGEGCDPAAVMESTEGKFGLFSIRERMEALEGWMELESKPGGGTTVTLGMMLGPARTGVNPAANGLKKNGALAEPVPLHGGGPSAPGRSSPVRVLLVDDHAMVRQGLRSVLDGYADLDVIAEAGDGEEAVNLAHLLGPDVIVMDVNLPRLDGIEATKRILLARPDTAIVGISVHQSEHVMLAMKSAGAAAFLTKESAADQLHETIEAVVNGKD